MFSRATSGAPSEAGTAGETNRPAFQSLVLGLLAIPTAFAFGLGAVVGVAAVGLGIRGLRVAGEGGGNGRILAIVGIVGGTIGFLMVLGYILDQAGV